MTKFSYSSIFDDSLLPETSGALIAVRAIMLKTKQLFGFRAFPLVQDDDMKGAVRRALKISTEDRSHNLYPFGAMTITSLGVKDDTHNIKNIARSGSGISVTENMESATIIKHYKVWASVSLDLQFEFDDLIEALRFVEKLSLCLAAKKFNTGVKLDSGEEWSVLVESQREVSFPKAARDDETAPSIYRINHSIIVHTQFGENREVAKINNEGRIDTNITVANRLGDSE